MQKQANYVNNGYREMKSDSFDARSRGDGEHTNVGLVAIFHLFATQHDWQDIVTIIGTAMSFCFYIIDTIHWIGAIHVE